MHNSYHKHVHWRQQQLGYVQTINMQSHEASLMHSTTVLQRLVNFEGYYLDGEEAASVAREPVYQSHKLESLEAEAKYTDNRTMVRLTGRYQIK